MRVAAVAAGFGAGGVGTNATGGGGVGLGAMLIVGGGCTGTWICTSGGGI